MTSSPPEERGRLAPTSPASITAWAVVGLVGGWLVRRIADWVDRPAPMVTWTQSLALVFVAAILAAVAWLTHRSHRSAEDRVEAHRMVNRLVLARDRAGGRPAGRCLRRLRPQLDRRPVRVADRTNAARLAAAAGGVLMTVASMLLERACRVRSDDEPA